MGEVRTSGPIVSYDLIGPIIIVGIVVCEGRRVVGQTPEIPNLPVTESVYTVLIFVVGVVNPY